MLLKRKPQAPDGIICVAKILALCAPMPKKYGGSVMEKKEKKRAALFLCQAKREHSRLVPQELCPPPW